MHSYLILCLYITINAHVIFVGYGVGGLRYHRVPARSNSASVPRLFKRTASLKNGESVDSCYRFPSLLFPPYTTQTLLN